MLSYLSLPKFDFLLISPIDSFVNSRPLRSILYSMGYDAFLTDTLVLDKNVFKLWLLGFNIEQATSVCCKHLPLSACIVRTQYRNFGIELLSQYRTSFRISARTKITQYSTIIRASA
jgi:hypothetical protein